MTSSESFRGNLPSLGSAIDMLEEEQAKLTEFQRKVSETSTVVESRNKMLSVTMDGNGELQELKFNTTAYRSMAPAELSSVITETLQKARNQSLQTMQELMGGTGVPGGIDVKDLASGEADFATVLGKIMEPSMDLMREASGTPETKPEPEQEDDDGWERR